mgnify:FL=1
MDENIKKIPELFGCMVFNEDKMRQRLSPDAYNAWRQCMTQGTTLPRSIADQIAAAMKDWATELGATHYTHWFQPMTGVTAEKHDSFITPSGKDAVIMELSGKELSRGEADASSFPSGGLRATFEARGYTAWDPTSYAFVKDKTLYIPTVFCSYSGQVLDKKTPLLRSMSRLDQQSLRILRLFGNTEAKHVIPQVGPEQEYFLIDKSMYQKREDLKLCGRTLFGARPPKGQELDDHYYGAIRPRVARFMEDLDLELWKLGVFAKTEHNEVAPAQHEIAPVYTDANTATDHNQLTMSLLKKVADRHGLVCLLHEKPFAGVNGSGKHNNWSLSADTGVNLLSPGETPYENAQFLLFLAAVIQAVDNYQGLLRAAVATAGNDHRLGANEAPPAVVSVFLGDELTAILEAIETDTSYSGMEKKKLKLGADVLPRFFRDTTDRNRTSPFAFTGNKFEFRMLGSSNSIACANIMLNTAVAESLRLFADELEGAADLSAALHDLIQRTIREHKRIIFNGNGYDDAWIEEATKNRGLLNLRTTPDAIPMLIQKDNLDMLVRHKVYTESELRSRYEIQLENYCKTVRIEALAMVDISRKEILPAVESYVSGLASAVGAKKAIDAELPWGYEKKQLRRLASLVDAIDDRVDALEEKLIRLDTLSGSMEEAAFIRDELLPGMGALRAATDEAETQTAASYWPFPTYGDLLFGVR